MVESRVQQGLNHDKFTQPPAIYRPAPLWVWNDEMTVANIQQQLRELKAHGFGGAFVHPRPGLITEYLSDAWFSCWQEALDEAERLELKLYIYDENSYPSGFAGGHIPSQLPDCLANAVTIRKLDKHSLAAEFSLSSPMLNRPGHPIRIYAYEEILGERTMIRDLRDLSESDPSQWKEKGEQFLILELGTPETNAWLGGFAYTDTLRPEVTELFLQTTYEAYYSRFGAHFGGVIPAIFTDEPEISPGNLFQEGGHFLPFTYWFAAQFELRNGYDLKDYLPCLFMDVADGILDRDPLKVRYDYYCTLHQLWVDNSVRPISQWCKQHNIAYTGHFIEQSWPYPWGRSSPSVMSLYEYMDWPAIDMLMTYLLKKDGIESHLMMTIREAHSAANQFNRPRVLCEAYGAGGWDSTFEDYKRIGDWLFVHGINFLSQHLTYSTIVGARKRDHPQSFDWRQSWWEEYTELNDYYSRLSYILSEGETHNRILVLNPTTSFYLATPDSAEPGLAPTQDSTVKEDLELFQWLSDNQWDYDFGDEYILERHSRVENQQIIVGARKYEVIIIPRSMIQIKSSTLGLLEQFLTEGGQLIAMGEPITRVNGEKNASAAQLSQSAGWLQATGLQALDRLLRSRLFPRIEWQTEDALPQGIAHLRRVMQDGSRVYFIINSGSVEVEASVYIEGEFVESWDAWSGSKEPIPYEKINGRLHIPVHLSGSGSLLLYISDKSRPVNTVVESVPDKVNLRIKTNHTSVSVDFANCPLQIIAEQPNILILDYCDLQVGSKTYPNLYTLFAGKKVFEHHGFETNPWDNGVQFKRRLVDRNRFFDEHTGFEATFHFYIKPGELPTAMTLLVERAEFYEILVNGTPVSAYQQNSLLDHQIGEVDITRHIHAEQNVVTLKTSPFHVLLELEAVYLQGDFTVEKSDDKWVIGKKVELSLGSWVPQGYYFYPGAVNYKRNVVVQQASFQQIVIQLPKWEGTVASVFVNGQKAGLIGVGKGNCLEITDYIKQGDNEITVRICGSFKNLLGPHHDPEHPRKIAWPGNWKKSPIYGPASADQYDLISYGLIEDFLVNYDLNFNS